jgi:hypothetical protein
MCAQYATCGFPWKSCGSTAPTATVNHLFRLMADRRHQRSQVQLPLPSPWIPMMRRKHTLFLSHRHLRFSLDADSRWDLVLCIILLSIFRPRLQSRVSVVLSSSQETRRPRPWKRERRPTRSHQALHVLPKLRLPTSNYSKIRLRNPSHGALCAGGIFTMRLPLWNTRRDVTVM